MHRRLWTLSLALLAVGSASSSLGGDWPRFRGANYDGVSTEKDWLGNWPGGQPRQLWKKNVGTGFASMAVAGGRVYTAGHAGAAKGQDTVFCFDATIGNEIWKSPYAEELDPKYYEGGPSATPTVDGDRIYIFSKHGEVRCLEAATGKQVWGRNIAKELGVEIPTWGFAGSPHVEGHLLILNAGTAGVALDKTSGKEIWVSGKLASGYSTPVAADFDGKRVLVLFGASQVFGSDPQTGKILWHHPWNTEYDVNSADTLVSGDKVYVSSGYDKGNAALEVKDGKVHQLWFNKEIRAHFSTPVIIGNYVYGIDGSGGDQSTLKCLDLATGKVVWTSPKAATGALAAADGKIIWISGSGELVIAEASPAGYKELARAQVLGGKIWTSPVLANGKLYIRNAGGDLVCLDVKGAAAG
jgi:outer membrane protein assembly factor BamB